MLIGGQAVLLHGEPRLTQDIDVTLGVGPDSVKAVLEASRAAGLDPVPEDPSTFVKRTFVRRKRDEIDWEYLGRWAREFASVPGREDMLRRVELLRAGDPDRL